MNRFIAILAMGLCACNASRAQSTDVEVHLRGTVQNVILLSQFSGKAIPIGFDPRFALTVRIESATPGVPGFAEGDAVTFAIHSPALLFGVAGETTKGKTYDFSVARTSKDGKVRFSELEVREVPAKESSPESGHNDMPLESRIPAGGAALYGREIGHGTAIIVLHGGPDFDHSYLVPDLDRLADSFRLIYYDQRGRGRSADGVKPEDVTLASDIADIEKVREHFKLDSVVLLGHSWGTVLALEYTLRYPERVSRLILMNPAPASTEDYKDLRKEWLEKRPDDTERRKAIAASAAYKEGDPEAVTAYYRIHFKSAFARPEEYERFMTRLSASFTKEGVLKARAVEERLMNDSWASPGYDLLTKLKNLKTSTLVIYGDHDFIPGNTAEHITQALRNARLVTFKDCGHFTYMECPSAVREQIDAFFRAK